MLCYDGQDTLYHAGLLLSQLDLHREHKFVSHDRRCVVVEFLLHLWLEHVVTNALLCTHLML